jgi:polyisoprenyl-teichoic acid--peptidoglycan teichoic acid transferase
MDNQEKAGNQGKKISTNNNWDNYSGGLNAAASYSDEDDFMQEIKASLAQQISTEMEDNETDTTNNIPKKGKFPKGLKIFAIAFSSIMLVLLLLVLTPGGQKLLFTIAGNYIYNKLDYEDTNQPVDNNTNNNTVPTQAPVKIEKDVINILLIGVEEIGGASNTDSLMIASMNTKDKSVKLTSIMRDLYVEIPGHDNNKINATYALGGIDLLYQTISRDFGIDIDGFVKVNFEAFEKIVDLVGGVDVTLTSKEAYYLNTTNYISDPAYRNVHEGTQLMTGNQALGYCRVRKVSTGTENNDFGRTQRQRAVLNSIFDKVKDMDVFSLVGLMDKFLTQVDIDTDITNSEFNNYLQLGVSLKLKELENYRIPSDGNYGSQRVQIGKYNVDVLVPTDWEATRAEIHEFIYGSDNSDTADSSTTGTGDGTTVEVTPTE